MPDTCTLETQTACGAGCEPVPLSRFIPINTKYEAAYKKQQIIPPCVFTQCPNAALGSANIPNYYAVCEAGRCVAADVRVSPLSACSSDSECILRPGTNPCDGGSLIAVSAKANVEAVFCGADACAADCKVAPVPQGVAAYCSLGHCLVRYSNVATDADAGG